LPNGWMLRANVVPLGGSRTVPRPRRGTDGEGLVELRQLGRLLDRPNSDESRDFHSVSPLLRLAEYDPRSLVRVEFVAPSLYLENHPKPRCYHLSISLARGRTA